MLYGWKEYKLFNMNFPTKVRSEESHLRVFHIKITESEMRRRDSTGLEGIFRVMSLLDAPVSSKFV